VNLEHDSPFSLTYGEFSYHISSNGQNLELTGTETPGHGTDPTKVLDRLEKVLFCSNDRLYRRREVFFA
jgi:hypothetical protein